MRLILLEEKKEALKCLPAQLWHDDTVIMDVAGLGTIAWNVTLGDKPMAYFKHKKEWKHIIFVDAESYKCLI
jgi:hypothetical protein